jgi:hypothetical protein
MFVLIVANVATLMRERPLVYVEGTKNIASRIAYDVQIPPIMRAIIACHPGAQVLMNTSVHPEFVAFSGIPLRQTINESDMEFYQAALAAPASHAAIVLAFDGDEIDRAVRAHHDGLSVAARFEAQYAPAGTIYVSDTSSRSSRP